VKPKLLERLAWGSAAERLSLEAVFGLVALVQRLAQGIQPPLLEAGDPDRPPTLGVADFPEWIMEWAWVRSLA